MSEQSLSEIRKRAWETRRQKYGVAGHAGSYARTTSPCPACHGAVGLLIRLHREGVLSEGQIAKATGIDRISIRELADLQELAHAR
jgi:hypothetical protein